MELFEKGQLSAKKAGYAFSLHVVCYVLLSFIFSVIIASFGLKEGSDALLYLSYSVSPIAIAISSLIFFKTTDTPFKNTLPVKCEIKYYFIAVLLCFGLMFSLGFVNEYTIKFLQLFGYKPREASSYLPSLDGGFVMLALLIIAVFPSVCEEYLFRGNLLNNVEQGVGTVNAIFITGFCFSLFHANPEQTVYQFICGCAFSFITLRSGSILPAIIMHFINNATIIILSAVGLTDVNGNLAISSEGSLILSIISGVCLVGALVLLILDKKPLKRAEKDGVKDFFKTASIAVVVLSAMWITSLF